MKSKMMMQNLFYESPPCIYRHVDTILSDGAAYRQALQEMIEKDTIGSLSSPAKARIIAALHITKEHKLLETVLPFCEATDLSKALSILDLPRQIRQAQRRIDTIEQAHPHLKEALNTMSTLKEALPVRRSRRKKTLSPKERRVRKGRIHARRRLLRELQSQQCDQQHSSEAHCAAAHANSAAEELITSASVSGSLARKVRQWAKTNHSADFLEFVMLSRMPTDPWKNLADLVHFATSDFQVGYFLDVTNGAEPPKDSFVASLRELESSPNDSIAHKFSATAESFPQTYLAYMYLRTMPRIAQNAAVAQNLAEHMPLSTAIWYLEELAQASKRVVPIVSSRVRKESLLNTESFTKVTTSYGKLLERILTFRSHGWEELARALAPLAETRLSYLKEKWYTPDKGITVVFGDASSSMTTAIRAATILATMVTTTWGGELSFFNHELISSPHKHPSSVSETLEICAKIRASGCTSLSAALWPYYKRGMKVDRIVLVTDEMENTKFNGYMFAPLLKKYKEDVNQNVKLILIAVGSGCKQFQDSLEKNRIDYRRVEIDGVRPDLTKFDALLGSIDTTPTKQRKDAKDDFVIV